MPDPIIGSIAMVILMAVFRIGMQVAISYLLNQALAKSVHDPKRPPQFPWGQQTTEAEGGAIQIAYGTNRVHANIVGHYLDIDTDYVDHDSIRKVNDVGRCILACFGEGPWATPDDTTIRLNGRPLSDLPDVTSEWRLGLVGQAAPTAWGTFRQDYHVGTLCLHDQPVTKTLNRTGFDDLDVILFFPRGLVHNGTDGDRHYEEVDTKIEVGDAIADSWQTIFDDTILAKTQVPCYVRFRASGTHAGGSAFNVTPTMQPRVRVTRLSEDQTHVRVFADMEFWSVQAHKNAAFTHPGMVLLSLGLVPNEAVSGGITELSVLSTGRIVADGDGNFGVSRYHADAIRDCLTQPVIEGDGGGTPFSSTYLRGVPSAQIVAAGFTAQKTLADTLVPDGLGNSVAMLCCDAVFSQGTSAHEAIAQIAASGRCGLTYSGRSFGLWVDNARVPVGLLCDGTWERDSAEPLPIEASELASEVSIRYREGDMGDAQQPILIIDHDLDTLTSVGLDLAAVRRMHEAARLGRRELARNRLVDQSLACRADIYAAVYEAGDVVLAQIDGWSLGGRLQAVASGSVTLDRSVTDLVSGDDVIVVQARNAVTGVQSLQYKTVTSAVGKIVTTSGAWTAVDGSSTATPAVNDPFLFGPADLLDDDQFEITAAVMDEHGHFALSCLRYVPELDDLDEVAPDIDVPLSSLDASHRYGGVLRRDVSGATIDQIGVRGDVRFEWGFYTFTANSPGAGSIAWATDEDEEGEDAGYVRHGADLHQPADGNTSLAWVYWDPADPEVFSATDDVADVVGLYLVAYNDGGTPITGFSWLPLNPLSADWALVTGAAKPEDNADVTADHPISTFRETFEDPHSDLVTRWPNLYESGAEYGVSSGAPGGLAGGKFLYAGNNSGNDQVWLVYYKSIPFDPGKLYRMRVRAQTCSGNDVLYAGVAGRNAADNAWVGVDGSNSYKPQHYVVAAGANVPGAGWITYTGYFKGTAATGDDTAHSDPADPGQLHTNVRYFRPILCCHYGDAAGIMAIDEVSIDIMSEEAAYQNTTGATAPAHEVGRQWVNTNWCGQDCVAHWRMNDGPYVIDKRVKDESPNGNHGTAQQNTWTISVAGKVGTALSFNGTTDKITVPDAASLDFGTGDFSGCAWIKTSYVAATQRILCKRDAGAIGFEFYIKNDGDLGIFIGDAGGNSYTVKTPPAAIRDGNWHFVGFTVDRDGSSYFYVDGVLSTAMDLTAHSGTVNNADSLYIGIYRDGSTTPFNGVLDDIMLFKRALTVADFQAIYDGGTGTEQIHLGSTRAVLRSDGASWYLSDSDSPTIPRHADEIAETDDRKWAAESGADITADHTAAAIASQGDLATMDTVATAYIDADAVTQIVEADTLSDVTVLPGPDYPALSYGKQNVIVETAQFTATGAPLIVSFGFSITSDFTNPTSLYWRVTRRKSTDINKSISAITLSGTDPVKITTSTAHGLTNGQPVWIDGVVGTTELNDGVFVITKVDDTNFTLNSTNSSSFTAYISGGTVRLVSHVRYFRFDLPADAFGTSIYRKVIDLVPADGETWQYLGTITSDNHTENATATDAEIMVMEVKR